MATVNTPPHAGGNIGSDSDTEPTLRTIMVKLNKLDEIETRLTKLDGIDSRLCGIENRLDDLQKTNDEFRQKTNAEIDRLAELIADNQRKHQMEDRRLLIAEYRVNQVEQVNSQLRLQLNDLDNRSKLTNLKIDGKYEDASEDLRKFVTEMANYLIPSGLDTAAVLSAYRLGKPQPPQTKPGQRHPRPRTIMVTFRNVQDRNLVFYARLKLRDNNNYRAIYLNDDTTTMTRKAREDYRSVAALAQTKGNNIKVHGDGIVIDGRKYRHGEADQLPSELSLAKAKTVQVDNGLFFSSEHSFLSNFYPAPVVDQGIIYPTAEHRLQALKCETAGDQHRLELVRSATTPLDAKKIGDQIVETPQWRNGREAALKIILDLKFDQHPQLSSMLLNTGSLKLFEATNNMYYGIGTTLHSRDMRDKNYSGLNKLGVALQNKRDMTRTASTNPEGTQG